MDEKVIKLRVAEPHSEAPRPELIDLFTSLLEQAKSGTLTMACLTFTIKNDTSLVFVGLETHHDILHYMGMLEVGKTELAHQILSSRME